MKPPPAAMGHGEDEGELKGFEWSTVAAMMRAMMKLLERENARTCQHASSVALLVLVYSQHDLADDHWPPRASCESGVDD